VADDRSKPTLALFSRDLGSAQKLERFAARSDFSNTGPKKESRTDPP
jgi:hypothetical protein